LAQTKGSALILQVTTCWYSDCFYVHEKGGLTGAIAQKLGRFDMADTGTLFLDEIGDLPLPLQPKLLRVLQEREFERLGSDRTHRINVRLVTSTHRDLTKVVAKRITNVTNIEEPEIRLLD
jgi:transcriptional regulator with GAF, ATPase, and Fis domain